MICYDDVIGVLEVYGCVIEPSDMEGISTVTGGGILGEVEDAGGGEWYLWLDNENIFGDLSLSAVVMSHDTVPLECEESEFGVRFLSLLQILGSERGYSYTKAGRTDLLCLSEQKLY